MASFCAKIYVTFAVFDATNASGSGCISSLILFSSITDQRIHWEYWHKHTLFWCYLGIVVVNFLQLMEYRWTFKVYTIQLLLYICKKGIYSLPNAPLCIWYIVTALGFMGIYIDSVLETNHPVNLLGDAWNQNRTMWVWDASGFQRVPATKTFAVGVLYRIMLDACLQLQKLDWVWCANVHKSTCRVIWRWWWNIKMSRACGWKTDIG